MRSEFIQDPFGSNLGLHNYVNMVGSYMCGKQTPTAVRAVRLESRHHGGPAVAVK